MEIWALIISIASLMISTFFTLWNTRPHIKIKADFSGYSVSLKMIVVTIRYSNASSVAGTISGAYILIENQKIPCLEINEVFDTTPICMRKITGASIRIEDSQLRTPIQILPFQSGVGILVFPLASADLVRTSFRLYIKRVGGWRKKFKIKATFADEIKQTKSNVVNGE